MKPPLLYALIAVALLAVGVLLFRSFSGDGQPPLDPPEVVLERVETAPTEVERSQAARDLVRHGEAAREEIHTALVRKQPEEPEVIAPLLQATMKVRDHRSLPKAIDLLDHPDPLVRGRAGAAVREILGADFGFRANDPPEKRAKVVAMIKADYANAHQRIGEFYESQR